MCVCVCVCVCVWICTVDRVKHRELTTANQVDVVIVSGLTITI